ncbi:annexin A13-like [Cimex lectularius]|uniref:Annexin n=1 Tax=Cimex lectularius TaxID=79782 RepID=A0A8I6SNH9_CIMLE|nr:annexin A13-like [Cimex lectularius]
MDLFLAGHTSRGSTKTPFDGVLPVYEPLNLSNRKSDKFQDDRFKLRRTSSIVDILNSESQAKKLHSALHSVDGEVGTIISILSRMSQYQRTRILHYYKSLFGRKLSTDMKNVLGGDFCDACLMLISDPKVIACKQIYDLLIEFPFPREERLISILCERSNEEIQIIQHTYEKKFGESLEKSFLHYLDSEKAKFIKILVNPLRQEDWSLNSLQVHVDAQNLLNLGIGVSYGDSPNPIIYSLLRKRGFNHLRNVFAEYERLTGKKVWNMLEPAMPQNCRKILVLIMEAVNNPELFTAKVLLSSTPNFAEFYKTLLVTRLTRNKEFYNLVEYRFTEFCNRRISDVVKSEDNSALRTLLLSLMYL